MSETEVVENVITLKNGATLTILPLLRGKRKEALRNLEKRGIYPSVTDMRVLNGIELQTELAFVCWSEYKRIDGTCASDKERRKALDEAGDVLTDMIVQRATKLAEVFGAAWEIEEKNS
jgi:predicted nucleic acid-binding protein